MVSIRPSARKSMLTGLAGGLLSGVVGGGGGAVMIPLMTGALKMQQHVAHGTSLVIISFCTLAGALTYSAEGHADFRMVALLVAGSTGGAYAGAKASSRIPALRLRQLLGGFLVTVALRMLFVGSVSPVFATEGVAETAGALAIGLVGGLTSGALGVGGGAIFVPALVLLLGIGQHEAQGISIWVIVFASAVGGFTHYRQGTVDAVTARWIIPAAVPSGVAGSLLATKLDPRQLQVIFAAILVALGSQMLVTASRRLRAGQTTAIMASEHPGS